MKTPGAMHSTRLLALALLLLLGAELLAGFGWMPAPHRALSVFASSDWPFFSFALAGAGLLHWAARPQRRELLLTLALAAAVAALLLASRPAAARHPLIFAVNLAAWAGLASLATLGWRALRERGALGASARDSFALAAALPLFVLAAYSYVALTGTLHPRTPDLQAFAFDAALGGQPSFALGRLFADVPPLAVACMLTYQALPLGFALLIARLRPRSPAAAAELLAGFFAAGVVGFALYHVFPLAGPKATFVAQFPHLVPRLLAGPVPLVELPPTFRNAMPSLHTAWVLLLWWGSRGCATPTRAASAWFLVATLLATLGSGEHYLVDLVVALPFALGVRAGCAGFAPAGRRLGAAAAGALLTLLWLALLRLGQPLWRDAPGTSWALVSATVAISLGLEAWLSAAPARPPPDPPPARPG